MILVYVLMCLSWWLSGFFWSLYCFSRDRYNDAEKLEQIDVLSAMMAGALGPILIIASGIAYTVNKIWR